MATRKTSNKRGRKDAPKPFEAITMFPAAALLEDGARLNNLPRWDLEKRRMQCVDATASISKAGRLKVPTGRIVVLDPFVSSRQKPVPGKVEPGTYDVLKTTLRVPGERASISGALTLQIRRVRRGETLRYKLGPSIAVDSASVAFIDKSALRPLFHDLVPRDDYDHFAKLDALISTDKTIINKKTKANIVTGASGGDGFYKPLCAYDEDKKLVFIMVSFTIVLVEEVHLNELHVVQAQSRWLR